MDAFVTAGGIPGPEDLLYSEAQGRSKSLLDVAGRPMAQWALDALGQSSRVGRVVLVGLDPGCGLRCRKPLTFLPDQGGMLENIEAGLHALQGGASGPLVLAATSDIPTITTEAVDWAIQTAEQTDHDLYYFAVEREVMERRFPTSRRSYVRLKDAELCGADLHVLRADLVADRQFWARMLEARKNAAKQAALLGLDLLFLLLIRQVTLAGAERKVSRRLGLRGRVIPSPYAELGMDVDKPHQLALVREDLGARAAPRR